VSKLFLKYQKCLAKYLSKLFCLIGFTEKRKFQCVFDDKLSVTYVFIKEIFRAAEEATPSPLPPTVLCRGWGSSGSFQPEALSLVMAIKP
jgi:hypothetical protein